jgi:hypothetical protein
VNVVRLTDGRLSILGIQVSPGPAMNRPVHRVRMAIQEYPGGGFGEWRDLGNPAGSHEAWRRDVGMPVAAVDGTGRMTVFARNAGLGVSACAEQTDGTFGPWKDLSGLRIQEGLAAATDSAGRIELFAAALPNRWRWRNPASGKPGMWHWLQTRPGGSMKSIGWFISPTPATGPITVTSDPAGRLVLVAREPGTGSTLVLHQSSPGGDWPRRPEHAAGPGAFGPVSAVVTADGTLFLCGRDDHGTVGIFDGRTWSASGPLFAHAPALALDHTGRAVAAVLGCDGRLQVARRPSGSSWSWQAVES